MPPPAHDHAAPDSPFRPIAGIWRIGTLEVHEPTGRVTADGSVRELDRSSHQVLRYLLEHAEEVVTKEELLGAGWPGRVVAENSLTKAIGRLRATLGESAAIRTVHGYGYRFSGRASFVPRAGAQEQPPPDVGTVLAGEARWTLVERLGEVPGGALFLARHGDGDERGLVRVACDADGLLALRREIAVRRYLQAAAPDLAGVRVLDWNVEQPPCFAALPYARTADLQGWMDDRGGLQALPPVQRLHLFASLCDAVGTLHQVGVIHGRIAPDALFPQTGAEGGWSLQLAELGMVAVAPTLLRTGPESTPGAAGQAWAPAHVPYVAPELIAGGPATQRSDVFSLGVLLYQFVVADLRRPLAPGWEDDVDDPLLREDIAVAAAARPERRLVDARALAERVRSLPRRRAMLDEERGRTDALRRQARQLETLRQRRRWLHAGLVVLGSVLALSLWQQHRVQAARDAMQAAVLDARQNAAIADAVNRFFNQDVLSAASPYAVAGRSEPTVREAIAHAAARLDDRLADQPIVEASVRMAIGQALGESMQIGEAIEQGRRAVALFERHLGDEDPRTQRARYRLAADLTDASRFDEAWQLIASTDATRHRLGQDDAETQLQSHRASCYWHIWRQRYDPGQPACEGAIAAQLRVDANDHTALIKTRTNLAVLHSRAGRHAEAEEQFVRIGQAFDALGDRASPTWLRASYLHGMNLLALGRHAEAGHLLDAVHRGSTGALGADNPHTLEVQVGLARAHLLQARAADAVQLLEEALAAYVRQLGEDNHHTADARQALQDARCAAGLDQGGACG